MAITSNDRGYDSKDLVGLSVYRDVEACLQDDALCPVEVEKIELMLGHYLDNVGSRAQNRRMTQIDEMDEALENDYSNVCKAGSWTEYKANCAIRELGNLRRTA